MTTTAATPPVPPAQPADDNVFVRRLLIVTSTLILVVLGIHVLEKFKSILQPLFIGLIITYLILPVHAWLVRLGLRPIIAYVVLLVLLLLAVAGVGALVYSNYEAATARLPVYERRAESIVQDVVGWLSLEVPGLEGRFLREIPVGQIFSSTQVLGAAGAVLGTFFDFSTWLAVMFVYLIFLVIERESLARRIVLAFNDHQGGRVLAVFASINLAIAQYLSIKTLVSLLAGVLSTVVLLAFGVDFAITWGLLIFLLNFIPYIGSLVATALPILLSVVQFDELWKPVVIALLLVGIQQAIGNIVEPRMAGRRFDVSPLLLLLSLAFWGLVWGVVGMILAVPLVVVVKIVLENIKETRPIAILISNA